MGKLKNGLVSLLALPVLAGGVSGCLTPRGEYFVNELGRAATHRAVGNAIDRSQGVNRGTEVNVYNERPEGDRSEREFYGPYISVEVPENPDVHKKLVKLPKSALYGYKGPLLMYWRKDDSWSYRDSQGSVRIVKEDVQKDTYYYGTGDGWKKVPERTMMIFIP